MRRKLAIIFLILMSCAIFAGCKKKNITKNEQTEIETAIEDTTVETQADGSPVETESPVTDAQGNTVSTVAGQTNAAVQRGNNGGNQGQQQQNSVVGSVAKNNNVTSAPTAAPTAKPAANNCTISISVNQIKNNMSKLPERKHKLIPSSGMLLGNTSMSFSSEESAYDILQKATRQKGIHLDVQYTAMYGSIYIKGIGNIYEFDCGGNSGWLYSVNGSTPSYGCSKYKVKPGDKIVFYYKCG